MTTVRSHVSTTLTDSNGWAYKNDGAYTTYYKRLGPYTVNSVAGNSNNTFASAVSLPTGLTLADILNIRMFGLNDNANSGSFYISGTFDIGGAGTTFDMALRNLATTTQSYSSVYVFIEIVVAS